MVKARRKFGRIRTVERAVPQEGGQPLGLGFHFQRGACVLELRAGCQPSPAARFPLFEPLCFSPREPEFLCPPFDPRPTPARTHTPASGHFFLLPLNSSPVLPRERNELLDRRVYFCDEFIADIANHPREIGYHSLIPVLKYATQFFVNLHG